MDEVEHFTFGSRKRPPETLLFAGEWLRFDSGGLWPGVTFHNHIHHNQQGKTTHETNDQLLGTSSFLRIHLAHRTIRLHQLGRRLVATGFFRVPAYVLLLCRSTYVPDAARDS